MTKSTVRVYTRTVLFYRRITAGHFFFRDSFSTKASSRYSTDGSTTVIITTEQTVPMPMSKPTVEMEFWLEMKWITKPHTVRIIPEVNTVGIAASTDSRSAVARSWLCRYAT